MGFDRKVPQTLEGENREFDEGQTRSRCNYASRYCFGIALLVEIPGYVGPRGNDVI